MRLKRAQKNKTETKKFRCTKREENALQRKANIYTEGNLSEYMIYAGLNFVAGKEDFEVKPKKGRKK